MRRVLRHLFLPGWLARRAFTSPVLNRIERAIRESERVHDAQLRFVVEGDLDIHHLWRGATARDRAVELFSQLRVWDTEHNSGILIYVQCVDRCLEIVCDRGIAAKVSVSDWNAISDRIQGAFLTGRYEEGALRGIREITTLLAAHFPAGASKPDELSDRPLVL